MGDGIKDIPGLPTPDDDRERLLGLLLREDVERDLLTKMSEASRRFAAGSHSLMGPHHVAAFVHNEGESPGSKGIYADLLMKDIEEKLKDDHTAIAVVLDTESWLNADPNLVSRLDQSSAQFQWSLITAALKNVQSDENRFAVIDEIPTVTEEDFTSYGDLWEYFSDRPSKVVIAIKYPEQRVPELDHIVRNLAKLPGIDIRILVDEGVLYAISQTGPAYNFVAEDGLGEGGIYSGTLRAKRVTDYLTRFQLACLPGHGSVRFVNIDPEMPASIILESVSEHSPAEDRERVVVAQGPDDVVGLGENVNIVLADADKIGQEASVRLAKWAQENKKIFVCMSIHGRDRRRREPSALLRELIESVGSENISEIE